MLLLFFRAFQSNTFTAKTKQICGEGIFLHLCVIRGTRGGVDLHRYSVYSVGPPAKRVLFSPPSTHNTAKHCPCYLLSFVFYLLGKEHCEEIITYIVRFYFSTLNFLYDCTDH